MAETLKGNATSSLKPTGTYMGPKEVGRIWKFKEEGTSLHYKPFEGL